MTYHNTDESVANVARAAFPNYKGRKVKLSVSDRPLNCASYWNGGTRSYYRFVRLADLVMSDEVPAQSAFDKPVKGIEAVTLPEGFACVEHSIFCGSDTGLTVHIRPENAAALLPKATQELTRNQKIVLVAARSLKSSYAGISNYRFHEANRDTGITAAEYEQAKLDCQQAGLLDKRGAITASGKDAAGNIQLWNLK